MLSGVTWAMFSLSRWIQGQLDETGPVRHQVTVRLSPACLMIGPCWYVSVVSKLRVADEASSAYPGLHCGSPKHQER